MALRPCKDRGRPVTTNDAPDAAGAVAGPDAVLHPGGLASRRAQVPGMARSLHRRCAVLHAATQERSAAGIAPGADTAWRPGDPGGGQALSIWRCGWTDSTPEWPGPNTRPPAPATLSAIWRRSRWKTATCRPGPHSWCTARTWRLIISCCPDIGR